MSNRISAVFSVSVFAILAAGVGSGYLLHNNHKVNEAIKQEDQVLAPLAPPVEVAPQVQEMKAEVAEAPKQNPIVRKFITPKVKVAQAAILQDKPCEMVCEDQWQESNYGGGYKRCECKK